MARIATYSRPRSIDEALELAEADRAVVVGGGVTLRARPVDAEADAVDLQSLGLDGIERIDDRTVRIGATATLHDIAESDALPQALRSSARREQPSTLRHQATLGGLVATGSFDSELLAVLLVHDAVVSLLSRAGDEEVGLGELLRQLPLRAGRLVVSVTVSTSGLSTLARTARTGADRAIVAAAARRDGDGRRLLALCGVATVPVLVESLDELAPPADFRGSSEYRRALAGVLSARVLKEVS